VKLSKLLNFSFSSAVLALALAACGTTTLGGGGTGTGGDGAGGGGTGGGNNACSDPNPAGCKVTGCEPGFICANEGCSSSSCFCDPESGGWGCTDDCNGGTCVPDTGACSEPNPEGCKSQGCPAGQTCDVNQGCAPSVCFCDADTGTWGCTEDCGGGVCVPDQPLTCATPNPEGCVDNGCPAGQTCDVNQGCNPTDCQCDPDTGSWVCTKDCGGGTCVPDAIACEDPNPAGCKQTGCKAGEVCADVGCTPSVCGCDPQTGEWICTADCGGGTCVPADPGTCPGPNPQGCMNKGCPDGQKCVQQGCAPSVCNCDAQTGSWFCTADCGGGVCVAP
jgi:hypothetical protein